MRVLGEEADALIGRRMPDLVHQEDVANATALVADAPRGTAATRTFVMRFRHADGTFRVLEGLATNLLADAAVAGIVINARDISERRQAEQTLRERDEELRQAQKMEAIGRLAGG